MQQIWRAQIGRVLMLASDEGARVDFWRWLASNGPLGWRSDWIGIRHIAHEGFALRELRVGQCCSGSGIRNFSIARNQFIRGRIPFCGGLFQKQVARSGSGTAKLRRHVRCGAAAERAHVERRKRGIAHDHTNAGKWNAKFVGDRLRERGASILADFDFTGEDGYDAIVVDVQP